MKKICFLLILLCILNASIFSQENDKLFTIQSSPIALIFYLINLGIDIEDIYFLMDLEGQYKINDIINLSLTLSFLIYNYYKYSYYDYPYIENSYLEKTFQFIVKPMVIYRPFKTGLKGFYIGLYPVIGWHTFDSKRDDISLRTEIGIGINTGYKWIFNNGFTLQLGTGIGKSWSIPERPNFYAGLKSDGRLSLDRFDLYILDLKLGYSF